MPHSRAQAKLLQRFGQTRFVPCPAVGNCLCACAHCTVNGDKQQHHWQASASCAPQARTPRTRGPQTTLRLSSRDGNQSNARPSYFRREFPRNRRGKDQREREAKLATSKDLAMMRDRSERSGRLRYHSSSTRTVERSNAGACVCETSRVLRCRILSVFSSSRHVTNK